MIPPLDADFDLCARTVWGEARGEAYVGKLAVAHVLLNRWRCQSGQFAKDDTLATTCLRHLQFSCWTMADPNFAKMHAIRLATDQSFAECYRAVLDAYHSPVDTTNGALWYHTTAISPSWAAGRVPSKTIGNHKFYDDIDGPAPGVSVTPMQSKGA